MSVQGINSFGELELGMHAQFEIEVQAEDLDKFCELSGDNNPLHMNEKYAKEKKFEGRVAHGLLLGSYFSRLIGTMLPGEKALIHESSLRFRQPVVPPAKILVYGEISFLSASTQTMEIKVRITQNSKKMVTGKFQVGFLSD